MKLEPTRSAAIIEVIRTVSLIGGSDERDDPVRELIQYWSTDGVLLAETDTYKAEKRILEGLDLTDCYGV